MGGLGNQLFQYATARALAIQNDAELCIDTVTGFRHDTVFRRTYELGAFPIRARVATRAERAPFLLERAFGIERAWRRRFGPPVSGARRSRPWGTYFFETQLQYLPELQSRNVARRVWLDGHWQSEQYFAAVAPVIATELAPPPPTDPAFHDMARTMQQCNSVAVGVRLFEEVPGATKVGVGGLTPMDFYNRAAELIATRVKDPVFFVFCTTQAPSLTELRLPGPVRYITHDNGYHGGVARFWLLTQGRHHILSNSSFYWWAAWLAERRSVDSVVVASALFPNRDTIPRRWTALA